MSGTYSWKYSWLLGVFMLCAAAGATAQQKEIERTGGPYVPTPQVVVDQMLRMGSVGPNDYVIDLGSGDGVIVLTAATRFKASGMGVEIDPQLVKLANDEAKKRGVADRASFVVQDVFRADLSKATVVTLYLLPGMMINLRSKIFNDLKPGTRVVSHDYHFDDWQSDDIITFDVPEKEKINGVPSATVRLWIIPAKVAGLWRVTTDSGEAYDLNLRQTYQNFDGTVASAGRTNKLMQTSLRGEQIAFTVPGGTRLAFQGRVTGESMQGTVDLGGGKTAKWTATRPGATAAR